MAQSPMISCPLKETDEIDWIQPLKNYIRTTYGDDPERYSEECATLNRLRQDMRGAGKDSAAGRDILYRYYGQLELLDLRFPVDENHIQVSFTWYDAFTAKPTSQFSLAFEKASIIFNISAVLSCHAANQNRAEEGALKIAYHSFQAAAGMFTYINDNFLHAPSLDLSRETVKTLISISLAQAQEVFLEKQVSDGKKAALLAKLAAQAQLLYAQAVEGCQENVATGIFDRAWSSVLQTKAAQIASLSEYYQALADEQSGSYGVAIARLQLAEKSSKAACAQAKSVPSSPSSESNLGSDTQSTLMQMTKRRLEIVQEKLPSLIKDNDFVYHHTVPADASLAPVSKLPAAKAMPVSELYQGQDIQRIIGPDIFQRLVPMSVTEQASLYDEEKAKLVRSEAEKVETANGEMDASLDYLKLPQSLGVLKGGMMDEEMAVDEEFIQWCGDLADYNSSASAIHDLSKKKNDILSEISQATKQLDMEESVCEKMRSKYGSDWTQQPSSRLTAIFRTDLRSHRDTIDEAANTDAQLTATMRQYQSDFEEMRAAGEADEADVLFQKALIKGGAGKESKNRQGRRSSSGSKSGPENQSRSSHDDDQHLLDEDYSQAGPSVADQIARVEELLKKLNLIKRERAQVLTDLKERVRTDDISNVLILNKKSIANQENQLFQAELDKFRSHQNRLLATTHKQQSLLRELSKAYGELLQDKRVRAEQQKYEAIARSRTSVMNRYRKIFHIYEELREGLHRAESFYGEMKDTIDNISQNVDGFVNSRRAEGAQLLNQIEQNKASSANSQASVERDRLQQLMERMSMDPNDSRKSPNPALSAASSHQNARPSPAPTQHPAVNADPRFTIPPQKTPRPAEPHLYQHAGMPNDQHDSLPLSSALQGSQQPPQQIYHHPQQSSIPPQPYPFTQGAALPLSEGYHPMAYPPPQQQPQYQPGPHAPQFFPPISATPQPGTTFFPAAPHHHQQQQQQHHSSGMGPPPPPPPPPTLPSSTTPQPHQYPSQMLHHHNQQPTGQHSAVSSPPPQHPPQHQTSPYHVTTTATTPHVRNNSSSLSTTTATTPAAVASPSLYVPPPPSRPPQPFSSQQPQSQQGSLPPPPPTHPSGSTTTYPSAAEAGPMPSGPGGYAQVGRDSAAVSATRSQQVSQGGQGQASVSTPADPWAGLGAWR